MFRTKASVFGQASILGHKERMGQYLFTEEDTNGPVPPVLPLVLVEAVVRTLFA